MSKYLVEFSLILIIVQVCKCQSILKAPPRVETKPNYLDSYIPAGMQIIVHLTELMKYEMTPQTASSGSTVTTTSTVRPTPSHKPAIYAPLQAPGAQAYDSNSQAKYEDYITWLQKPEHWSNFARYASFLEYQPDVKDDALTENNNRESFSRSYQARFINNDEVPQEIEQYFDANFLNMFKLINRIEDNSLPKSEDDQIQNFLRDFDDSDFRSVLLRQKKVPPTKAYVTLLSLYDLLNKESKRLGLNKYNGYTEQILKELNQFASSTSSYQLREVLNKILQRDDTKKPDIVKKIKQILTDLDVPNSYINDALSPIPPLSFAL